MHHITNQYIHSTNSHPTQRAQKPEKSGFAACCKRFSAIFALLAVIGMHQAINETPRHGVIPATHSATDSHILRADWAGELIDIIDEILDILEGNDSSSSGSGDGDGEGEGDGEGDDGDGDDGDGDGDGEGEGEGGEGDD